MATTNKDKEPTAKDFAVKVVKSKVLTWALGLIGASAIPLLLALLLVVAVFAALAASSSTNTGGTPSSLAQELIPPEMLALYQSDSVKSQCPGLSWTIVAAIIHLESNDGRNKAVSSAGARGPSQFLPTTWDSQGRLVVDVGMPYGKIPDGAGYGLDGDGDGLADIENPYDSVPATARLLCANGGGEESTLPNAIYSYNRAWWYVYGGTSDSGTPFEGVIPLAARLGSTFLTDGGLAGSGKRVTYDGRPNWLEAVPSTNYVCDYRIVADVQRLIQMGLTVTACYALSGHATDGEHPLGLAIDAVPVDGNWDRTLAVAEAVGWRPSCASSGCASQMPSPFRFVGYNGYPGHGDPWNCLCGNDAHIHLSWMHAPSFPGIPAAWVEVM
ncbi:lytic transglycosylase domain-containing protein [Candidatus Saccharibacteria bacterium]|nr:lytic transglycosylase domain-containing protein [Candidatus Saccharibacteria bacterium]